MTAVAKNISPSVPHKVRLSDVAVIDKAKHMGELPYVGLEDISNATGEFLGSYEPRSMKSTTFRFTSKHVLYGRLRPYLNKALLPDFEGHCSSEIFPIRPSKDLDRRYLFYWLTWPETCNRIAATETGARMPRANMKEVMAFDIPLPPLDEQKRIVAVLDQAFAALERARAHVKANLANSEELFERSLDREMERLSSSYAPVSLRKVVTFHNGDRGKNYPNKRDYVETGIPWINTGQILASGRLSEVRMNFITKEKYDQLGGGKTQAGDLVYCLRGATIGKTAFVGTNVPGAIASSLMIIRPKENLNDRFAYFYLVSDLGKKEILRFISGAAQPNLAGSNVGDFQVPLPPVTEQAQVANRLELARQHTFAAVSLYKSKLDGLANLRQSILQSAFAGQLT